MKSIQQRLQSRISLRRNHIRMLEDSLAEVKAERTRLNNSLSYSSILKTDVEYAETLEQWMFLNEVVRDARKLIQAVGKDQKLDKDLHTLICRDMWLGLYVG